MGFKETIVKNLPTILTGLSIVGVGATVFFVAKVSPEAKKRYDKLKVEKQVKLSTEIEERITAENPDMPEAEVYEKTEEELATIPAIKQLPDIKDVAKEVAILYVPAVLMGGATIACIVAANTINLKRLTATSAALTASEEAFRLYKEKVVEQIGEKKAAEVIEKVAKKKTDENPPQTENNPSGATVIVTNDGDTLCYDEYTGRWFRSDIDKIHRVVNELNNRLNHEDWITLNEWYEELGLPAVKLGDDLGWDVMRGLIEPAYSSILADEEHGGIPAFVISFVVNPQPRYKYGDGMW